MKKTGNILSILFLIFSTGLLFSYIFLPEYGEHVLAYFICSNGMLFIFSCMILVIFPFSCIRKLEKMFENGELNDEYTRRLRKMIGIYIGVSAGIALIIYGIVKLTLYYIAINAATTVVITIFCVSFILIGILVWLLLFPITKKLDEKYNIPLRKIFVIGLAFVMLITGVVMTARNLVKAKKDIMCGRQSIILYNCYYSSSHSRYKGTTYDLFGDCESGHVKFDISGIGESMLEEINGKNVRVSFYPNTQCVYSAEIVE